MRSVELTRLPRNELRKRSREGGNQGTPRSSDLVIIENPANRGTETSAEVLVSPPWRMESNAGQQQWCGGVLSVYTPQTAAHVGHSVRSTAPPPPSASSVGVTQISKDGDSGTSRRKRPPTADEAPRDRQRHPLPPPPCPTTHTQTEEQLIPRWTLGAFIGRERAAGRATLPFATCHRVPSQ